MIRGAQEHNEHVTLVKNNYPLRIKKGKLCLELIQNTNSLIFVRRQDSVRRRRNVLLGELYTQVRSWGS